MDLFLLNQLNQVQKIPNEPSEVTKAKYFIRDEFLVIYFILYLYK
jgi:hypothetical protein